MSYILTAEGKTTSVRFSRKAAADPLAKFEELRAEGNSVKIIGPDGKEITEHQLRDRA
jgi:hypothetical protein